jgi:hypothetical protein
MKMFYKQTAYETCLAISLMTICEIRHDPKKELEIWKHGWKLNYLTGQLDFVAKKYKVNFTAIVESKPYANEIKKSISSRVQIESKPVTTKLIDRLLERGPVVVYADNFYFSDQVHAPHFLTVTLKNNNKYIVADSWDGKVKEISQALLNKSITSLRKHLLFSPVIVYKR